MKDPTQAVCPMKFNTLDESLKGDPDDPRAPVSCDGKLCAWWNAQIGMCGVVVPAYLQGIEVHRQELRR